MLKNNFFAKDFINSQIFSWTISIKKFLCLKIFSQSRIQRTSLYDILSPKQNDLYFFSDAQICGCSHGTAIFGGKPNQTPAPASDWSPKAHRVSKHITSLQLSGLQYLASWRQKKNEESRICLTAMRCILHLSNIHFSSLIHMSVPQLLTLLDSCNVNLTLISAISCRCYYRDHADS